MKIKFNSDNKLSLNDTIGILSMPMVVRAIFENKYYPQVSLEEWLYKI